MFNDIYILLKLYPNNFILDCAYNLNITWEIIQSKPNINWSYQSISINS
jgi:hypothetical protein